MLEPSDVQVNSCDVTPIMNQQIKRVAGMLFREEHRLFAVVLFH